MTITIDLHDSLHTKEQDIQHLFQHNAYTDLIKNLNRIIGFINDLDYRQLESVSKCRQLNTIFIAGDRGTGKTTFLLNIESYIENHKDDHYHAAISRDLIIIPPIDPTLLEHKGEVYEDFLTAIIAHFFNLFQSDWQTPDALEKAKPVFIAADKVSLSLKGLGRKEESGLEKIVTFQSSLELEQNLHIFFQAICMLFRKKAIVLLIDDTDMALGRCYEVVDTIRRYFSSPYVIPIITGQIELYKHQIGSVFSRELSISDTNMDRKLLNNVRDGYLRKVFPDDFHIGLEHFTEVCNTNGVLIVNDVHAIPLIFLNELHKRLLFPGVAGRHYKEIIDSSYELLTARAALQRIHLHRDEIDGIISLYYELFNDTNTHPSLYFDLFYHKPNKTTTNRIKDNLRAYLNSNRKEKGFYHLRYNDIPYVINILYATILVNGIERTNSTLRYVDMVERWTHQESHLPRFDSEFSSAYQIDRASIYGGEFSTQVCFRNTMRRLSLINDMEVRNSNQLDINTIDLYLEENLLDKDTDIFYSMLFFAARKVKIGHEQQPLATARKFVELLFYTMDKAGDNPREIEKIVGLIDDRHPTEHETTVHNFIDGELRLNINKWQNRYHIKHRHIAGFQMELILKKMVEQIEHYFHVSTNFFDYTLLELATSLCYLFLNSLSWSEKELNYFEGYFSPRGNYDESAIYQINIGQMVDSDYLSLTKLFHRHPLIKPILAISSSDSTDSKLRLDSQITLHAGVKGWAVEFIEYQGKIEKTNLELQDVAQRLISKLKNYHLSRQNKEELLDQLKNPKADRIFRNIPKLLLEEIAERIGVDYRELLIKRTNDTSTE
ncbi:MAG: P-loop NTPase fold protein [Sedimenticola sp.]